MKIKKKQKHFSFSQETLAIEKQLLEQKDTELRQVQTDIEKLLQERKAYLKALEEEKERTRMQVRNRKSLNAGNYKL